MLLIATMLTAALVLVAPYTRSSRRARVAFAAAVMLLDALAAREIGSSVPSPPASTAVAFAGVLMLTLPGFALWWTALDREAGLRRLALDHLARAGGLRAWLEAEPGSGNSDALGTSLPGEALAGPPPTVDARP